jgi:aspartate-semialdehyde dehydrogenase
MIDKKEKYSIAIVGATGAVGRKMISTLEKRNHFTADSTCGTYYSN